MTVAITGPSLNSTAAAKAAMFGGDDDANILPDTCSFRQTFCTSPSNCGNEPAVFIGSRNEPTAQESVVMRPEMDARVISAITPPAKLPKAEHEREGTTAPNSGQPFVFSKC
jgi:hypothetical protein